MNRTAIYTAIWLGLAIGPLSAKGHRSGSDKVAENRPTLFEHHCAHPGEDQAVDTAVDALKYHIKEDDCDAAFQALKQATWLTLDHPDLTDLRVLNDFPQVQSLTVLSDKALAVSQLTELLELRLLKIVAPITVFRYPGTGLKRLHIENADTITLEQTENLGTLSELFLVNSPLANSAALSKLRGLRILRATHSELKGIDWLPPLQNLEQLILDDNHIADIRPLRQLNRLAVLALSGNPITDISPLVGLGLKRLRINRIPLADHEQLAELRGLESLAIAGLGLTSLKMLTDCEKLENLVASHNKLRSAEELSSCPLLRNLYLSHNKIASFGAGSRDTNGKEPFPSLINLDLSHNQLQQVGALPERVFDLSLSHNPLASLESFATQPRPNLYRLKIRSTKVADLTPLRGLTGLAELYADDGVLTSLEGIQYARGLRKLSAAFCRIQSLEPLAKLSRLTSLDLQANEIRDASPLAGLSKMVALDLYTNPLGDTVKKTPSNCPTDSANAPLNDWCLE